MAGRLIFIATPIGNSADLSQRAMLSLEAADFIAAEDTRKAVHLFRAIGIRPNGKLISFYTANEKSRTSELVNAVVQGQTVVLMTDAGIPGISDPGYSLMSAAISEGLKPIVIPGPSAVTTAVLLSGFEMERFIFDGFIPRSSGARKKYFASIKDENRLVVLFESPRRLLSSLEDAAEIFEPEREVAICRELTKVHEEIIRGNLTKALNWAKSNEVLGEITLVIAPSKKSVQYTDEEVKSQLSNLLASGLDKKSAISQTVKDSGRTKREVYAMAHDLA